MRADLIDAWKAALAAVDPERAVAEACAKGALAPATSQRARRGGRDLVVATGKAAAGMLRGLPGAVTGFALLPANAPARELPSGIRALYAVHPVPTKEGIAAGHEILAAVDRLGPEDRLVFLVSGGSSSLFEVPADGVDTDALIEAYRVLLGCGAAIDEVNAVRTALSAVKGGGLARRAYPACVVTLALSDVPGDRAAVIGSGPTVPRDGAAPEALRVVARYRLGASLPRSIVSFLNDAAHGAPAKLPPSGAGGYTVVGSNAQAVDAAAGLLATRGYEVVEARAWALQGDVVAAASQLTRRIRSLLDGARPTAIVLGGETTVRLPARAGRGGRCSQLAATLAVELAERAGFACLAASTDGMDGTGPGAGAIIDGTTAGRCTAAGTPLPDALARYDTHPALAAAGDLLVSAPTGTNVADVVIAATAA